MVGYTLQELIERFEKEELSKLSRKEKRLEKIRVSFVNDYPINKILELSIDDYSMGYSNDKQRKSFCYRLQYSLSRLGGISEIGYLKFGVYFNKNEQKYQATGKYASDSVESSFMILKETIYQLLLAGQEENYEKIAEISITFKGKLLGTYFPETYLCINREQDADRLLKILDIKVENEAYIYKQKKILEWKKEHLPKWSNFQFIQFCYDYLQAKHRNRDKEEAEMYALIEDNYNQRISDKIANTDYTYINKKAHKRFYKGCYYYLRDENVALHALHNADFKCEVNNEHITPMRKNIDIPYTEPHH
ncbi:MAG: hypothetical protein ACK5LC_01310, partial [Coprobacillaceae bacterium]